MKELNFDPLVSMTGTVAHIVVVVNEAENLFQIILEKAAELIVIKILFM